MQDDGSRRYLFEGHAEGVHLLKREGTILDHTIARYILVISLALVCIIGLAGFFYKYVTQVTFVVDYVKYDKSDSD